MDLNFIWLIISIFWTIIAFIFSIMFWVNFIRVFFIERKIKKLYSERDAKISEIRKSTGLTSTVEGMSKQEMRNFNEQIEPLERKRRFILDKLPFLRK